MSIGVLLVSVELIMMLIICFSFPASCRRSFIGFAIGESLGASALRIGRWHIHKIAISGSDLMKSYSKLKDIHVTRVSLLTVQEIMLVIA